MFAKILLGPSGPSPKAPSAFTFKNLNTVEVKLGHGNKDPKERVVWLA